MAPRPGGERARVVPRAIQKPSRITSSAPACEAPAAERSRRGPRPRSTLGKGREPRRPTTSGTSGGLGTPACAQPAGVRLSPSNRGACCPSHGDRVGANSTCSIIVRGKGGNVRYMVIESYTQGPRPVYARAADRGRMLPRGLAYVDSWIDE